MANVCPNCQHQLTPGETACPVCRRPVAGTAAPSPGSSPSRPAAPRWRRSLRHLLVAFALSFLIPVLPHAWHWLRLRLPLWSSPLVMEAVERAKDHPRVTTLLGHPVRSGWFVKGYIRTNETGWSEGRLWIPVSGTKGKGTLYARAGRGSGPWVFTTLELRSGENALVNLLEPGARFKPIGLVPRGRVYLVHLGIPDLVLLDGFPEYYRATLDLQVDLLPPLPLDPAAFDPGRRQYVAELLIASMRRNLPQVAADPSAVVIGIVEADMYIAELTWNFAFNYRSGGRIGVVATPRMTPYLHRFWRRDALFSARVRKMVTKNVGVLAYGLPLSNDPTSLLYGDIGGTDDLDLVQERFEGLGRQAVVDPTVTAHQEVAVEPEVRQRGGMKVAEETRYPCFVVRPGLTGSVATPVAAGVSACAPGMRTEREYDEFEVDLRRGLLVTRKTDLYVHDVIPLVLTRSYRLWDSRSRSFGIGGNHPYDILQTGSRSPYTVMDLWTADGQGIHYERISEGTGYADALYEHTGQVTAFRGSRIKWNGNGWDVRFADGSLWLFPENYYGTRSNQGTPTEMRDGKGNVLRFQRDRDRNLERLISPGGHFISFEHDDHYRVTRATDDQRRSVGYVYDSGGRIASVTDEWGQVVRYRYEGTDLVAVEAGDGRLLLRVRYAARRVSGLDLGDGRSFRFAFVFPGRSPYEEAIEARVVAPDGQQTRIDAKGRTLARGRGP